MTRSATQSASQLDSLVERLTRLGATADEVAAAREQWDEFDEQWTPETRAELLTWSDDKLRDELLRTRAEFDDSTLSDDERAAAADEAHRAQLDAAIGQARDIIGLSVARLIEWVGDDALRAEAVLTVELEAGDPRKTLVEPLTAMVHGS